MSTGRGSGKCLSYRGDQLNDEDRVLTRLRCNLIAVAIECNRYCFVRRLLNQKEGPYFGRINALDPDEYRMELTVAAYIREDFRIQKNLNLNHKPK